MKEQVIEVNIQVNRIKELYLETRTGEIPTRAELLERNVTEDFWEGFYGALDHKELWNCAIRGKTGSSKSTVAFLLTHKGLTHLQRIKRINIPKEKYQKYLYSMISSDQTEFMRFAMNHQGETMAMIDEFSTMGETGFNATTEQAMYAEHSDLFAQERIHKTSCSPSHINDKNADIILDFIGRDDDNKVTRMMLNYKDPTEWIIYPLGVVNFYLGEILDMEAYKWYRDKKFKRLDLLKKHAIRNVKELEFSRVTMETYDRLKELAEIEKQQDEDILTVVDGVRRRNKMQYSIITLNYVVIRVKSLLNNLTKLGKLERKIRKELHNIDNPELEAAIRNNDAEQIARELDAMGKRDLKILLLARKQYLVDLEEKLREEKEKIQIEIQYRSIE